MKWLLFAIGLCALIAMVTLSAPAQAAFISQPGARSAAFGGSFVAVADDANAIFLNPSGVAQLSGMEFTAMYARLYPWIKGDKFQERLAGYAVPINLRSIGHLGFGLGWNAFMSDRWEENTFTLSCSYCTPDGFIPGRLSLGGNIKRMSWKADLSGSNSPLGDSVYSGPKIGLDAGMLWSLNIPFPVREDAFVRDSNFLIRVGAFIRNFNEPDIAPNNAEYTGKLPMETAIGLSCNPVLDLAVLIIRPLASAELRMVDGKDSWHAGGELSLSAGKKLGLPIAPLSAVLRIGRRNFLEEDAGAVKRTIGFGGQLWIFALDYSYEYTTEGIFQNTERISQIQGTIKFPPDFFLW